MFNGPLSAEIIWYIAICTDLSLINHYFKGSNSSCQIAHHLLIKKQSCVNFNIGNCHLVKPDHTQQTRDQARFDPFCSGAL